MDNQDNTTLLSPNQMGQYDSFNTKTLIQYKHVLSQLSELYFKYDIDPKEYNELYGEISKLVNMERKAGALLIKACYDIKELE